MSLVQNNGPIRIKHIRCLMFLFLLLVLMPLWSAPTEAAGKPVAKVNGAVLTEGDLEEALNEIMPAAVFHGGFSSEKRAKYRPQAFEKMIEKELLYQEAVKKGLKVPKEVIEKEREKTIKRLGGKKNFKAALKRSGLSEKKYKKKLSKKYLLKQIISLEIKKKARMTDEDLKVYYEKNKERLVRPESRRLTHILVKVAPNAIAEERHQRRRRAQEVIDKIKAGEDMSKLAWDYSDGPYRVKGGNLGLIHTGRLDPELEKEAFKLEPGKLSNIIETRFGYHIVRVEEVRAPEQLSLKEASPKIKKDLTEKKEKQLREELMARLRAEAKIEKY